MTRPELYSNGKPVALAQRIGKGGEGEVYTLSDTRDYALKYYTLKDLANREAKVSAMLRAKLSERYKLVAFPVSIVSDRKNRFAGFLMRLVPDCKPLHELYAPGSRKTHFPKADFRFLTRTAVNVARAIVQVHDAGCVIGDINHSGVLISQQATVSLIDADSFQFTEGNKPHLCTVGVAEYTPPELQGHRLDAVVRTPNHDSFGLAIVIFQLLFMGKHPFSGRYAGTGDMPMEKAISEYRFAYSLKRVTGLSPPPGASDLTDIPPWLAEMFEQAFSQQYQDQRPTAAQWVSALEKFEATLTQCSQNTLHYFSNTARSCPWCDFEQNVGIVLFIPDVAAFTQQAFTGGKFNADQLWRTIEALNLPALASVQPPIGTLTGRPTAEAAAVKNSVANLGPKRLAILVGTIALIIFRPDSMMYFIGAAGLCWFAIEKTRPAIQPFVNRFDDARKKWDAAAEQWYSSLNLNQIAEAYFNVESWVKQYQGLRGEYNTRTTEIANLHKERQLEDFLDRFLIADEIAKGRLKVSGLHRGKQSALLSHNIETFADVDKKACLAVPGIGNGITSGLMHYRSKLAVSFRPSAQMSAGEKQDRMKLDLEFQTRSKELQRRIENTAQEIAHAAAKVKAIATQQNLPLKALRQTLLDAAEDLSILGEARQASIPSPAIRSNPFLHRTAKSAPSHAHGNSARPGSFGATGQLPSCPNCGAVMTRRTNRRRGNYFWGCPRYPTCKGTRNYP